MKALRFVIAVLLINLALGYLLYVLKIPTAYFESAI